MKKYQTLDEFFADLDPHTFQQVTLLRRIILTAEPALQENLKWNAPNYAYKGVDRITFNLMNKERKVKLLIHMGAKRKDDRAARPVLEQYEEIVDWQSDIRGIISFEDGRDIESNKEALTNLIRDWLSIEA